MVRVVRRLWHEFLDLLPRPVIPCATMSAEELANVNVEAVEVARRQLSRKRSNNEVHRTRRAKVGVFMNSIVHR